ncbi:hypothetical protein Sjap_025729 [Stephania japonica]|uniref:Uncharacterized protein n=1 Tax=Stephania japonica TaxID=461633 RepID=A0AAP0HEF8_9MAGN
MLLKVAFLTKYVPSLPDPLWVYLQENAVYNLGAGFVQWYTLHSPIRFSITGYKHVGDQLKTANINQSRRSLYHFRIVDGVDLTKLEQKEGFPCLKLVHYCTQCNLEKIDAGHNCVVQVNVNKVFNGLVNKRKYMEYQMNCEYASRPNGSAIFFTLKEPHLDCCII